MSTEYHYNYFPTILFIAYLRGVLPYIVHEIPLDHHFYLEWLEGLKNNLKLFMIKGEEEKMAALKLVGLLERYL